MDPEPQTLRIRRGRAWSETWAMADDENERPNLTGATASLEIFAASGTLPLVTATAVVSEATSGDDKGTVALSLTLSQVAELDDIRVAHWFFQLTDSLGKVHDCDGPVWMTDAT